ncbi:cysteine--tRNA ligase [Candidatus Pacearchaeota archaeon]|nr:cysteine--tRNA ligase [Candidatus Pacearchaeota archaeon]
MVLRLFNTLGRKKQAFKPIKPGEVGFYSCGPTVYWYQTIGNLRTYIFNDILKKVLEYDGFKVKHVMNVTDVGHLTSDADSGEDKMEKAAAKEGKRAEDIANHYWQVFREDFKKLNISEPSIWCKATEHINEQIELIKELEKKGFVYRTSDGIYFDTSKLEDYGKLALLDAENLKAGARIDLADKKNKTDFALWKFSDTPGLRQQEWQSPWGLGFPGWHIECSAMSSKYLGIPFDIHTGGIDHIPVHHTNEIAQGEAASGKKCVNYWLHGAFLTFKGEKVSKSKGGLYTISELQELGYKPLDYRFMCLLTHYRSSLDFTLDNLNAAKNGLEGLKNKIANISSNAPGGDGEKYLKEFEKSINDDLNMPGAIQALQKLLKDDKVSGKSKIELVRKMDAVFSLDLMKKERVIVPEEVQKLAEQRWQAKKTKNFKLADELRAKVTAMGFVIADMPEGYEIKKA